MTEQVQAERSMRMGRKGIKPPSATTTKRLRPTWSVFRHVLRLSDISAVVVAGLAASWVAHPWRPPSSQVVLVTYFSAIVIAALAQYCGCYNRLNMRSLGEQLGSSLISAGLSILVVAGGCLLSGGMDWELGRWGMPWAVLSVVLLAANRVLVASAIGLLRRRGYLHDSLAIVGAPQLAQRIAASLRTDTDSEIDIVGIFGDQTAPLDERRGVDDLVALARARPVDRIIIALPWSEEDRIAALLRRLRPLPARVELCSGEAFWDLDGAGSSQLSGIPLVTLANRRIGADNTLLKAIEDRLLAFLLLTALSPLLLLIALVIFVDNPGPVFFRQARFGFNNQIFSVLKFRTMRPDAAAAVEVVQATRGDARVTRVGRFLRRTSLDELPQLINVLWGEMSIVGPRPHAVQHNLKYAALFDEYLARHNLKPGITGWAQVNGLRGETDTDDKMKRRVECDLYYLENWSVVLDIKIIGLTALRAWKQDAAY